MGDLQGCYSVTRKNYIIVLDIIDMYMPIKLIQNSDSGLYKYVSQKKYIHGHSPDIHHQLNCEFQAISEYHLISSGNKAYQTNCVKILLINIVAPYPLPSFLKIYFWMKTVFPKQRLSYHIKCQLTSEP